MLNSFKKYLYFPLAGYFKFFAKQRLHRWKPLIIVITGSNGKTTLLHLIESQLGKKAKYSHEANSSFGIPFDILDIHRKDLVINEWLKIFFAPFINIFKPLPNEKYYVVEADCDRPHEGDFLSDLLLPNITLWTNIGRTHSMNFEKLVKNGEFDKVEPAIAHEYGYFAQRTLDLLVVNSDDQFERLEVNRSSADVINISQKDELTDYRIDNAKTSFIFKDGIYTFNYLLPEEFATSLLMCQALLKYLNEPFDKQFLNFRLPPGRNSIFKGIKNTVLVDSSYNANLNSMDAILNMFSKITASEKWVVLGDMLEQGVNEEEEHKNLAKLIMKYKLKKVILMGPRVSKYTSSELKRLGIVPAVCFVNPKEVLDYLKNNIKGREVILFKGARFLEGVIENLLADKKNAKFLARREKIWEIRRRKWGL